MLPLGDLIRSHNISFHFYADDSQLYLSFSPVDELSANSCKADIEACIKDIRKWLAENFLKLNDEKTEFLLISSKTSTTTSIQSIQVGNDSIQTSDKVRNIGAIFDSNMTMQSHIKNITKQAHFQLKNIGNIRKFLTQQAVETLVHAFISSRIDNCNALLYGVPQCLINNLQRVQNTAARVVTGTKKFEHITPVLKTLHWLPVKERIQYKILLITFKVLWGVGPKYIRDLLTIHTPVRSLRSGDALELDIPDTKGMGDRAFSKAAPSLWNRLPKDIRQCTTVN